MSRVTALLVGALRELWSLIVDDGFLAVAALVAIGATYLLSREALLGPVDLVGWLFVLMLCVSMLLSLRRALASRTNP